MPVDLKSYIKGLVIKGGLLAALAVPGLHLEAQQTFNVKFDLGSNSIAGALFETNDGFLILGTGGDTLGATHTDMFILKTNNSGETMSLFHWGEPEKECYARTKAQGKFSDSTYITACLVVQPGPNECMLIWFDNDGDTLKTMHFPSPVVDEHEFVETRHLVVDPEEDCFYLSLGIYRPETQNDYVVQKRTKDGELLWEVYTDGPISEQSICMALEDSGLLISESSSTNDGYYRSIKKISKEGNYAWEFPVPPIAGSPMPRDILVVGDVLLCTGSGKPDGELFNVPLLYAVDTLGNVIWQTLANENPSLYQIMNNVVETCDSGYVGSARYHVPQVEGDTLDADDNYAAWLIRYDHEGNILWDRKFSEVNSERYNHEIYDLITTSDGGILFCGEAADHWSANPNMDAPAQQAWIVKLDACGCLVPGCDPECDPPDCHHPTNVPAPNYFLIGPNPVSEWLNIYIGDALANDALPTIYLYDLQGKLVDNFVVNNVNTTYIWNLSHLAQGQYVLSLQQGQTVLQTEVLVVSRR